MIVETKESIMVQPAQQTPQETIQCSNVDLMSPKFHTTTIYFYRPNGSTNFFDQNTLKEALGRALVPFYPLAGRLMTQPSGRCEIDCNSKGALFVVAHTESVLDDLGDFAPSSNHQLLIPAVDYSGDSSAYPLLLTQVTYFKCGGVSVGNALHHYVVDGISGLYFVNSWSEMARGLNLTIQPSLDRSILFRARDPPHTEFDHIEFKPPPPLIAHSKTKKAQQLPSVSSIFKFTQAQLNILKAKSKEGGNTSKFSSFEILAGHLWRCLSKVRDLDDHQGTKMCIPVDGRSRLEPATSLEYFGNVIFLCTPIATIGDLKSKPLSYAVSVIHDSLVQMDDKYLRSAIDYIELNPNALDFHKMAESPSWGLYVVSWTRLPIHGADFGWGGPTFTGPGLMMPGLAVLMPSTTNDGSISVMLALEADDMKAFDKLIYDI